ncbi:hypothetical protein IGI04_000612 [Brassica rapa subsp. trilocularis]|uniref:RING-type E3 ubiquitin transferase n=1 Tax=Brassica rapa subsp. trilocularis TaxID=1813537 RepID=A0ABQ7NQ89_BRACM|nr:hypothetical protein IGI04_000612 [Brassica rapa subsp. trilocularis]
MVYPLLQQQICPRMKHQTTTNLNSPVSLERFSGFPELGLSGSLSGQDSFHKLDRIEQYIELNYEELLIMDTGLLLAELSVYDQHHDMRLDIGNLSYEELLALEDRIGTHLSEETFKLWVYNLFFGSQEEYTIGDEVGRLHCEHTYHLKCVQEWLRMKSWCPICKTPAETSSSK